MPSNPFRRLAEWTVDPPPFDTPAARRLRERFVDAYTGLYTGLAGMALIALVVLVIEL